ncbi:MAG: DUF1508 domain-containing protein [Campylobacter sp.]|nr:DUF1508 domain-containing protein [Campylobacter sp.]
MASCKKSIQSVKKNSSFGKIEDLSVDSSQKLSFPKFQIYADKAGKFRFRLCATNGQIIATSDDFIKKEDCLKVINLVINQAKDAEISK